MSFKDWISTSGKIKELDLTSKKNKETLLETIDRLIDELARKERIELWSPDEKVLWEIQYSPYNKGFVVFYTIKGFPRTQLNPGWAAVNYVQKREDLTRIIIGQILVGQRESGGRLEALSCGWTIADNPPSHIRHF